MPKKAPVCITPYISKNPGKLPTTNCNGLDNMAEIISFALIPKTESKITDANAIGNIVSKNGKMDAKDLITAGGTSFGIFIVNLLVFIKNVNSAEDKNATIIPTNNEPVPKLVVSIIPEIISALLFIVNVPLVGRKIK
jgi:hypothetical protein